MKFEITSFISGSVLFSLETDSLKLAVEAAVNQRANLQGAYLQGADLQRAYLQGAYLQRADLQGADLQRANLQGAYLQRADLQGADLQRANLQGANLQRANLQRANLQGANLQRANLQGADLQKFPTQIIGHKHPMWTTQEGELQIGCHVHPFDQWRELAEDLGYKEGYDPTDIEIYKLHIEHLERISKLLWNKKVVS